jgi:hypothetical protein
MIVFEEQRRADSARIRQAVPERRTAEHRSSRDLAVVFALEQRKRRLDDLERHAQALAQLRSRQLASEMQRLGDDLQHQVTRKPGLFEVGRRRRIQRRVSGQHSYVPPPVLRAAPVSRGLPPA